jgi:SAM-dependent methyltransferase
MNHKKNKELKKKTAESFGFEWLKFRDIYTQYEANFLSYISPIGKDFFKGKWVLDAGCGAGRHSYFAAKYGASVIAVDNSLDALFAAKSNLKDLPDAMTMYMDIENPEMPFDFDYIMSIGVLHHLSDPRGGFNNLVKLLRKGGAISIWVYGRKDNKLALHLFEPLRKISTKIPHKILYYLAYLPAGIVELCNRLNMTLFSYYKQFPFRTKLNDSFDVFSAPSAKYYDLGEVKKWFKDAGLRNVEVSYRMLNGKAKGIKGFGIK